MKLTTTLLLCLGVNSVTAGVSSLLLTPPNSYFLLTVHSGNVTSKQEHQATALHTETALSPPGPVISHKCADSPCNKRNDPCTPNKFKEPGTGFQYADCNEGGKASS
ncbi:hypothetical protein Vi05172_g3033 [Venturia inaequalis]|nr:hypothetical protein Vi05172_g3033 [Venturia inaequalis]